MKKVVVSLMAICIATSANAVDLRHYVSLKASDVFAGTVDAGHDFDTKEFLGLSGAYGVKLSDFRVELEANLYSDIKLKKESAKLNEKSLFVNAYYDLITNSPFVPYAGIGLGYSRMTINVDDEHSDAALGAKIAVGTEWKVSREFSLDLSYRYNYFGGIDLDDETVRLWGHELLLGARYTF